MASSALMQPFLLVLYSYSFIVTLSARGDVHHRQPFPGVINGTGAKN
jgi:hypothetical protein